MPTDHAATLLRRPPGSARTDPLADVQIDLADEAPPLAAAFVRRPSLVQRLAGTHDARLALIVAPPGYGKSSLLSEWAEQDERRFMWLQIDPVDGSAEAEDDAPGLVAPVDFSGSGCVVVLDDAHLLPADILSGVTEAFLEELPSGSMLVLASRTEPDLPVGRLRAHRTLVEIRTPDLAMGDGEAEALLRGAGFELELDAVQELVRRTEGWPAALYLAALSQLEHPDAPAGVAGFRGDDHLLSEYLRDEVLSALPPEHLSFLTRTSVLERLSGRLCDAVTEERGGGVTLARLSRETGLLIPLDPAHESYRWHSLFRETLAAELRRSEPEVEPLLHRRASGWLSEHGDLDGAIEHACAARDSSRAGRLLWENLVPYLSRGRNDFVWRCLSRFTDEQLAADGPLALCAAHSSLEFGRIEESLRWARHAASALDASPATASASMRAALALIEASTARDVTTGMLGAAERACELAGVDSPWRPACCSLAGVAAHLSGDRERAATLLLQAGDLGGESAPSVTAVSLAQRAMLAIEQKNWGLAAELSDEAAAIVRDHGLEDVPSMALAFAAAAASRAHEGRADEAKADLRSGVDLLAGLPDVVPWYGAEASILLAHASLWLADVIGARTLLAQASRFVRRTANGAIFGPWFDDAWSYMDTLAETSLAGPSSLTIAELRILRFLPSHRSFREIAAQLGVSANTVKTQAHAVYRKLGAASRSEAVSRALDAGLLGQ
jgi:LuxR family maltose regulon positive regulatory protein